MLERLKAFSFSRASRVSEYSALKSPMIAVGTSGAGNALEGVTRATIFELARGAGLPVATGEFPLFDVYLAEEAFLTATSFSILPVASVNGKAMSAGAPGPVTRDVQLVLSELVTNAVIVETVFDWRLQQEEELRERVEGVSADQVRELVDDVAILVVGFAYEWKKGALDWE